MNTSLSPGQPASVEFQAWGYKHASRPNFAVRDLSLTISAGQRVLLLGASGIGKSTLLQGVAGILGSSQLYPTQEGFSQASSDEVEVEDADGGLTQGRILIDGVPVKQALGQVGLVLQDPDAQAIFQRVGDNVAFGPENMNVPPDKIWPLVEQSMSAVGLSDIQLHRSVTHLSGGQMQRLALAGALAMRPGVLLLDEPTANLDPSGVKQIVEAVGQVLDKQGSTMILVEHQAQAWIDLVDRVIVLGNERVTDEAQSKTVIVADGSPEDVFTDQSLDFASLGIWVPERYAKSSSGAQRFLDSSNRDSEDESVSKAVLLSTHDLAIGRDHTPIASGINLDFCAGQITALVGANGAGKTTLSLTLAGLLEAVDGTIEASSLLLGEAAKDRGCSNPYEWDSKTLASRISYVFQNPEHQFARGTVLEEVMLAPLRTGMSVEEAQNRAKSLLERFHLLQYSQENPYTLSGGEKRRLTVASALAAAPKVLILDEPTFGQDRVTWTNMVELIADLRNDGICVIVVTHDRQLVKALDARLVELTPQDVESTWLRKSDGTVKAGPQSLELASEVKQHCEQLPGHSSEIHIPVKAMEQRLEERRLSSKSPYIASINPSYRLIGGFLIALPLFFSLDWLSALTALVAEIVLLMLAGFSPWRIVRSTWPLFVGLPGSALAVLLYGKAGGEVLWQWGFINVTERSTMLAAATALRILAIGIPAIILMLGIDATDLADSFSQVLHLPDRFVYGGLAGMRLFSVLQDDWSSLTASRRSRGLGDENKFKAFLPQAFALLVLSIRRSSMLAEAMEARGFGGTGPRSHARKSQVQSRDFVFLSLCLTIPICSLLVAWRTGTFAFFGN